MKNNKSNEMEINIAVIGLSGSERDKGVKGVGKSCLCNRLAQPNHYKMKHSSVVTSIDFFGTEMNNNQLIFWGFIERNIRCKRYTFRIIEQTVMLDDISHCALSKKDEYIKRATAIEINGTKNVHLTGPTQTMVPPLSGKTPIHIFIIVYDVSNVEGRAQGVQDSMFKQLFDNVVSAKRPLIIATTKHDQASQTLIDQLNSILDKRPYNRYPVVETSANLAINLDHIFDLSSAMCDGSTKIPKQKILSYKEAFSSYQISLEQCRQDLKQVAMSVMDSEKWHSTWTELRLLPVLESWIERLGADTVETTFDGIRMDVRLKRRVSNQLRHKDCFLKLLSRSQHLLTSSCRDIDKVLAVLKTDKDFKANFIDFNRDAEYFDFEKNSNLLPQYILDETNDNNLIFVIKEYIEEMLMVDKLFQRLITDCPGNFRKSKKEIGDELRQYVKHFIPEKILFNVYEKFQKHYYHIIEGQFLEILHQTPKFFLSPGILNSTDILPDKLLRLNGISKHKSTANHSHHDNNQFVVTMTKEINSKIDFSLLSLSDDEYQMREVWINNYLEFLRSTNPLECIYHSVTQGFCNRTLLEEAGLALDINDGEEPCYAHISYIIIIGKNTMRKQLTDMIVSAQHSYILELCKVHSIKYEIKLLDSVEILKDIVNELSVRGDKCCSLCAMICSDDAHLQSVDIDRISHLELNSSYKLAKYLVHNVVEELISVTPFDDCCLYEDRPETNSVHISTLLSDCKRLVEPSIIWVVTVCGDLYDYDGLMSSFTKVLKLHSIPRRLKEDLVTLSGCFTSKDVDRQNYRLSFITYHQAMKALLLSQCPPRLDGLIFVASFDRLASLNTCLGMWEYLPRELRSHIHAMLLGVVGHNDILKNDATTKAYKYGMVTSFIAVDNLKNYDINSETENDILDFLSSIFKGPPTDEYTGSISTNASSLKSRSETMTGGSIKVTNQTVCKTCGQCRSYENINNNVRMLDLNHDEIFDEVHYEPILGETNAEQFDNCHPEFQFHECQDPTLNCTIINCKQHQPNANNDYIIDIARQSETVVNAPQQFRIRMRSQSGPDLRNSFESKDSSLNKSDSSSTTYCSTCGAKMIPSNDITDSRKSLFHKLSSDKESPSKKWTILIQDMFTGSRKPNESQTGDHHRKSFIRTASKRRK